MRRWLRLLISVFVLTAVLAGGTSGVRAEKAGHECDGMAASTVMDDCMGGEDGGTMAGCPPLDCVSAQISNPPSGNYVSPIVVQRLSAFLSRDDRNLHGLSGPPDTRPPIV